MRDGVRDDETNSEYYVRDSESYSEYDVCKSVNGRAEYVRNGKTDDEAVVSDESGDGIGHCVRKNKCPTDSATAHATS